MPIRSEDHPAEKPLREKYYHSKAAVFAASGEPRRAIRFLVRALSFGEHAYTRCDLATLYMAQGELGRAHRELVKGLLDDPRSPEAYRIRSEIHRATGNETAAGEDWRRAVGLDRNYDRLDAIRAAAESLERVYHDTEEIEWYLRNSAYPRAGAEVRNSKSEIRNIHDPLSPQIRNSKSEIRNIHDPRLAKIVRGNLERLTHRRDAVAGRSCIVPCPSYCCHFAHDPVVHGVYIGPWKLRAIRARLRERGFAEEEFLVRYPVGRRSYARQLIPPQFIVKDQGEEVVFSPSRGSWVLGHDRALHRPHARSYKELVWITEASRPCAFLSEGRCSIHDVGDEAGLPACKEFLCLTGFVFLVLADLGIGVPEAVASKGIGALNSYSIDAMLVLHRELHGHEQLLRLGREMEETVRAAVAADGEGDGRSTGKLVQRYLSLDIQHQSLRARQREKAVEEVRHLESASFYR